MSRPKDKPYTKLAPMGKTYPRRTKACFGGQPGSCLTADTDDRGAVVRQPKKRRHKEW